MNRDTRDNQSYILALEELSDGEEGFSCFLCLERLGLVQEVQNLCQDQTTLPWVDGSLVEGAGFLQDSTFVDMVKETGICSIFIAQRLRIAY
jgi:hypothetical protein